MRALPANGLVVSKSGNRNMGGTGEAGPSYTNVSAGVTSSRSGVSALMATTEAFSAVWLPVLVGTVAPTPGRPLKQNGGSNH